MNIDLRCLYPDVIEILRYSTNVVYAILSMLTVLSRSHAIHIGLLAFSESQCVLTIASPRRWPNGSDRFLEGVEFSHGFEYTLAPCTLAMCAKDTS